MSPNDELTRLNGDLHWKRLSSHWAKIEIVLGLTACVGGLIVALTPELIASTNAMSVVLGGGVLSVLGAYLALAGHRSHLYQSSSKLAAYVIWRCARVSNADQRNCAEVDSDAAHRSDFPGPHHN